MSFFRGEGARIVDRWSWKFIRAIWDTTEFVVYHFVVIQQRFSTFLAGAHVTLKSNYYILKNTLNAFLGIVRFRDLCHKD